MATNRLQKLHTSTPALRVCSASTISTNLLVAVLKQDRPLTIPTLRNLIRKAATTYAPIMPWEKLTRMTEPGMGIMSPYLPESPSRLLCEWPKVLGLWTKISRGRRLFGVNYTNSSGQ